MDFGVVALTEQEKECYMFAIFAVYSKYISLQKLMFFFVILSKPFDVNKEILAFATLDKLKTALLIRKPNNFLLCYQIVSFSNQFSIPASDHAL